MPKPKCKAPANKACKKDKMFKPFDLVVNQCLRHMFRVYKRHIIKKVLSFNWRNGKITLGTSKRCQLFIRSGVLYDKLLDVLYNDSFKGHHILNDRKLRQWRSNYQLTWCSYTISKSGPSLGSPATTFVKEVIKLADCPH